MEADPAPVQHMDSLYRTLESCRFFRLPHHCDRNLSFGFGPSGDIIQLFIYLKQLLNHEGKKVKQKCIIL